MTAQHPVTAPVCPGCRTSDHVQADRIGRRDRDVNASRHVWFCGACVLVFSGSAQELTAEAADTERRHVRDTYTRQKET